MALVQLMLLLLQLILLGLAHVPASTGQEPGLPCTHLAHHDQESLSIAM